MAAAAARAGRQVGKPVSSEGGGGTRSLYQILQVSDESCVGESRPGLQAEGRPVLRAGVQGRPHGMQQHWRRGGSLHWLAGGLVGVDGADWIIYKSLKIENCVYQEGVHSDSVETLVCRWSVDMRSSFGSHEVTKGSDATPKLLTKHQVRCRLNVVLIQFKNVEGSLAHQQHVNSGG